MGGHANIKFMSTTWIIKSRFEKRQRVEMQIASSIDARLALNQDIKHYSESTFNDLEVSYKEILLFSFLESEFDLT